jgi:uncharacterized protein (DUF362 family)/Pyruvate/2-oxoacid:ferredoxin oxidoreductase delta subunit
MAKVSIVKVKDVSRDVSRALNLAGAKIKKGDIVLIKPNICKATDKRGTVTNIEVVKAVVTWVRKMGGKPVVGDSPIPGNPDFESASGYSKLKEFRSLLTFPAKKVRLKKGKILKSVTLSGVKYDKVISVPLMKTHVQALVTLSLKNMMGLVPGRAKHELHKKGLHRSIADLNTVVKPDIALIDATWCMEGNGPIGGTAKKMDLLIASTDPVAADTVGTIVMGIDPMQVRHIVACEEAGLGTMDFEVVGEKIDDVASEFNLPFTYKSGPNILIGKAREFFASRVHVITDRLAKVTVNHDLCTLCRACIATCPEDAISIKDGKLHIDTNKCVRCLCCIEACPESALRYSGIL